MQGLGEQQLWSWDPWVAGCKVPRGVCSVSVGHPTSTQSIRLPAASCPTNCRSPGTSSEGSQRPRRFSAKRALKTQGLALRSLGKFPYLGHPPFHLEKGGPRVSRCAGQGDTHSRTGAEGEWGRGGSRAPEAPPEPEGHFHSQEKHSKWEDHPETASEGLEGGGVSDL